MPSRVEILRQLIEQRKESRMLVCPGCGVKFTRTAGRQKFCGEVCSTQARKELMKSWNKAYREGNPEKVNLDKKKYREAHAEKIRERGRAYGRANAERYREQSRAWREENAGYYNRYIKERKAVDPTFRISCILRVAVCSALTGLVKKNTKTEKLLGCSFAEARRHIEEQFEPWMTWENHGMHHATERRWQFDHIIPLAGFDLIDPAQQRIAFHYTNLRPLCAKQNSAKSDRMPCGNLARALKRGCR